MKVKYLVSANGKEWADQPVSTTQDVVGVVEQRINIEYY